MRVLVVGDPHIRTAALGDAELLLDRLAAVTAGASFELIVVTGDLLDEHAYVHTAALNAALRLVELLRPAARRGVYLLMGNHDLASNRVFLEGRHAFNALKSWPKVRVVDDVVVDDPFVCLPYVPPGRFLEALQTTGERWRSARAIFAHQEFRGARAGAHASRDGDYWPGAYPLVISGHYHARQWPRKNVCYVGAPMAHAFGDDEEKSVSVFEFPPAGGCREERLDLGLPRRRTLELSVADAEVLAPPVGPDHWRLVVSGPSAQLLQFRRSAAYDRLARAVRLVVLKPTSLPLAPRTLTAVGYLGLLRRYAEEDADPAVGELLTEILRDADSPNEHPGAPGA